MKTEIKPFLALRSDPPFSQTLPFLWPFLILHPSAAEKHSSNRIYGSGDVEWQIGIIPSV